MKKITSLMRFAALTVTMLTGCTGGASDTSQAQVNGETFDGGNISAFVPEGWAGFHGADTFKNYEEGYNPNVIQIVKGATTAIDMLTKPYVMISYYGPDTAFVSSKSFYADAEDIAPIVIGGYSWTGYKTDNFGYPTVVLETTNGATTISVLSILKNGDNEISLDDADVRAIIASITPAK